MTVGFPSHIVVKNVEDVAFFDGLLHGVQVKGLLPSFSIQSSEKLEGVRLGRSGKGNHGYIRLLAALFDFLPHFIFFGFLLIGIIVGKHRGNGLHERSLRGGVCLVNQNSESLILQIGK